MTTRGPRLTTLVRAAVHALACALLLACGGDAGTGPRGTPGTGGSSGGANGGNASTAIVGVWTRTIWFYDEYGALHSSRTQWTFAADGGAARTVTATNLSDGWSDATVALARWSISGGDVVIAFQPPFAGTARFAYRFESTIDGPLLWLGDTPFFKVVP